VERGKFFSHENRPHHEIGLYFTATLRPGSPMLDLTQHHRGVEGSKSLEFVWFPRMQVSSLDVRPAFLRNFLGQRQLEPGEPPRESRRLVDLS
jgi:hypothetical protein